MIWRCWIGAIRTGRCCTRSRGERGREGNLRVNVRRINLMLWTAAIVMAAGAAAVLALAVMAPVEVVPQAGVARPDRPATTSTTDRLPQLAAFEPVWKLDLRKSLNAETAVTPQAVTAAATIDSGLPITLVGTISDSLALVKTRSGEVEVRAAGETAAGGVKIVSVRPSQVEVEIGGKVVTLTTPKEPT